MQRVPWEGARAVTQAASPLCRESLPPVTIQNAPAADHPAACGRLGAVDSRREEGDVFFGPRWERGPGQMGPELTSSALREVWSSSSR